MTPGELAVGQWVTIHSWKPWDVHPMPFIDFASGAVSQAEPYTHEDRSYCGDCLRVEVVQLPFLIVTKHTRHNRIKGDALRLDTRRCTLMEISNDYIAADLGADHPAIGAIKS